MLRANRRLIGLRRRNAVAVCAAAVVVAVLSSPSASYAATHIPKTFYSTNQTWTRTGSPYVLDGQVTVAVGATLTIEPGVVVKVNPQPNNPLQGLRIQGTLRAQGTQDSPIVFTSIKDDSIGGDSGGDGQTQGAAGQWGSINITGSATFDWATVRYGGWNGGDPAYQSGAIHTWNATSVQVDNTIIEHNQNSGLLSNTQVPTEVNHSWIHDNGGGISLMGASSVLHLDGSIVEANAADGVRLSLSNNYAGPASTVMDSDIAYNGGHGINYAAPGTPQAASLPHGSRNNIYANGPASAGGLYEQLYPQLDTGIDANWEGNYLGEGIAYRANPAGCEQDGRRVAGRLVWTASATDPPKGPVNAGRYQHPTFYPEYAWCDFDYADAYPFSPTYIEHAVGPASNVQQQIALYGPILRYDSREPFWAGSPAMLTDSYVSGDHSNLLLNDAGSVLAAADPNLSDPGTSAPYADLSLFYLAAENAPYGGDLYAPLARSTDWIDAAGNDEPQYAADSQRMSIDEGLGNAVYSRVFTAPGGERVIQYWMFYYDNTRFLPGNLGDHEGDWEMIQVHLDPGGRPFQATYAQHGGGERCDWIHVEKFGSRPVVYVGLGSHASYFSSGPHLWDAGAVADITDGAVEFPSLYLVDLDPTAGWVQWPGHWGNSRGDSPSPQGPMHQGSGKWSDPISWSEAHAKGCTEDQVFP
jgi:hypothetical protein